MPAKVSSGAAAGLVEEFQPVRESVRPLACTRSGTIKDRCWVLAGPVAIDSDRRCRACRGRPNLAGNEVRHETALAKILASRPRVSHI